MIKITNVLTLNHNQLGCWADMHPFEGEIYHYPVKKRSGHYWGHGVFCSLACAKRFILMKYDGQYNILKLFENMIRDVFNMRRVHAAPVPYIIAGCSPELSPAITIDHYRELYRLPSIILSSHEITGGAPLTQTTQTNMDGKQYICWHDGYAFTSPSVPICTHYTDHTFQVIGHFCSLHCAKRYLIDRMFSMRPLLTLFSMLCWMVYHTEPSRIHPADSPYDLEKYSLSNHRSISAFRSTFIYPQADTSITVIRTRTYVYRVDNN